MTGNRPSTADKRKTFRKLHESGCFVIPNPWNVGSARYLQGLGFKALATTSSGHAHSQGYADGAQSRDQVLAHFRELAEATDVPLNADFEDGFADDLDGVAENVTRCVATGVAGLSIEDSPNNGDDAALRSRYRGGAREGRARRDRPRRRRCRVHRARGKLRPRRQRSRRRDPPLASLCRGRRRLPLCARHQEPRADRGGGQGGGAEAGEFPQQRRLRLHGGRHRGDGRAPDQRRRLARPRRDARFHPHRDRDRQRRQVRRLCRADHEPGAEQILQRGSHAERNHDGQFRTASANRPADRPAGRYDAGAASRARSR